MDLSGLQTLLVVGGGLVTAAGAWFAVKFSARSNTQEISKHAAQLEAQWKRLDSLDVATQQVQTTLEWLRRDVDELREENRYLRRRG
jgi:hypothetical protein